MAVNQYVNRGLDPSKVPHCPVCKDTRRVRLPNGDRVECECYEQIAMLMYLDPRLRPCAEIPASYMAAKPWPLRQLRTRDLTLDQFHLMCWRSLLPRWNNELQHRVMGVNELTDIQFHNHSVFPTITQMVEQTDVLILEVVPTVKSEVTGMIIYTVINEFVDRHKTLWLYQSMAGAMLVKMYGEYLADALERVPEITSVGQVVGKRVIQW